MDSEDKASLLNLVYEIPVLGPLLSNVILLAVPAGITLLILMPLGSIFPEAFLGRTTILVASGSLLAWLRFLEKRAGLRMMLPIPIISIPWLWAAWLGVAVGFAILLEIW